jgi:hypothetical protein
LRQVFEATVERCLKEDLVSGEGFAVDASLIPADANKTRSIPAAEWSPEVARAAGNRAAREYLETLDDAAFGAASESQPKFVAKSDPAAQWTRAEESRPYFAYATNYLVDTKCSVIMDVEGTRAIRQAEVGASQTMIDRTEKRFGIRPDWLAADTAYGSSENLGWLVKKRGIIPFIPVIDNTGRTDGTWSRAEFEWDEENDQYICPEGHALRQFRRNYSDPSRGKNITGTRKYPRAPGHLPGLPVEGSLLPERRRAIRHPDSGRGRARLRQGLPEDEGLQGLPGQAEEGRDALRPPQAHPEPHPPAPQRTERRQRRVTSSPSRPSPRTCGSSPSCGRRSVK